MLKCCLRTSHPRFGEESLKCGLCLRDVRVNKTSATFPAQESRGAVGLGFFSSVSGAPAVSNLPAIFFWASKAPRMAGSGHMGFSPRLWGLVTRGSNPSSGFGAGVSPELGSALHPKFLLTPAFKGCFIAGCACARGSLPEPG